jgi:dihydropteroate synthase
MIQPDSSFLTTPAAVAGRTAANVWTWNLSGDRQLCLGKSAVLMGIVNVTPDSFSDGGCFMESDKAVAHALLLAEQGAEIVDVGGMSTRPGSCEVSAEEELKRVLPVIEGIRARSSVAISIDTYSSEVAGRAVACGADIVNDISAFSFDPEMLPLLVELGIPAVAMHVQGTPHDMQKAPRYTDVVSEVKSQLEAVLCRAEAAGLSRENLAIDPGIGFGKNLEHNLTLIRELSGFRSLGSPLLLGASRKSFIGAVLGSGSQVDQRLEGTLAVSAWAVSVGIEILRVHDVEANLRIIKMIEAVMGRE